MKANYRQPSLGEMPVLGGASYTLPANFGQRADRENVWQHTISRYSQVDFAGTYPRKGATEAFGKKRKSGWQEIFNLPPLQLGKPFSHRAEEGDLLSEMLNDTRF